MIGFYSYTVILTYLSLVFAMVGIHLSVIGVYQWSFICLMMCQKLVFLMPYGSIGLFIPHDNKIF